MDVWLLLGKPIELLTLDVDGVLLDLVACFQTNLELAARKMCLPTYPIQNFLDKIKSDGRAGGLGFRKDLQGLWPHLTERGVDEFLEIFDKVEEANPYPPIPGSLDTVKFFNECNIPVALCTNNSKKVLERKLKSAGFDLELFAAASTSDLGYPKPDPRALDPIFAKIPVSRGSVCYVGDGWLDLDAALQAGVRFIAALSGGIDQEFFLKEGIPPNHIINSVPDLVPLLRRPS